MAVLLSEVHVSILLQAISTSKIISQDQQESFRPWL